MIMRRSRPHKVYILAEGIMISVMCNAVKETFPGGYNDFSQKLISVRSLQRNTF